MFVIFVQLKRPQTEYHENTYKVSRQANNLVCTENVSVGRNIHHQYAPSLAPKHQLNEMNILIIIMLSIKGG